MGVTVEADYLVVGAGAMGMAFTDALIDHADVHVTMVDRRHAAGGHWQDAYPFVQLHQASMFYGLTGLHGAHVFVGLTILLFATIRAFRGHFSAAHHHGVELPGIYWHFVDVMWIVVYTTVYIL